VPKGRNKYIQMDEKEYELLRDHLEKEYEITNPAYVKFFYYYINNGFVAYDAYMRAFEIENKRSAQVMGSKLLRNIDFTKLLDLSGHGVDAINDALERLKIKKPDKYLHFQSKFRGMDTQKIEHSGQVNVILESELDE
jgi:hypothetical protein